MKVMLTLPFLTTINVYDIYSATADPTKPLPPMNTVTANNVQFSMGNTALVFVYKPSACMFIGTRKTNDD